MESNSMIKIVHITDEQNKEFHSKGELKIDWATISVKGDAIVLKAEDMTIVDRVLRIYGLKWPNGLPFKSAFEDFFDIKQEGVHDNSEYVY